MNHIQKLLKFSTKEQWLVSLENPMLHSIWSKTFHLDIANICAQNQNKADPRSSCYTHTVVVQLSIPFSLDGVFSMFIFSLLLRLASLTHLFILTGLTTVCVTFFLFSMNAWPFYMLLKNTHDNKNFSDCLVKIFLQKHHVKAKNCVCDWWHWLHWVTLHCRPAQWRVWGHHHWQLDQQSFRCTQESGRNHRQKSHLLRMWPSGWPDSAQNICQGTMGFLITTLKKSWPLLLWHRILVHSSASFANSIRIFL